MSTVVMHAVVSVDGFIADENDEVGPLFDWYFNGDQPIVDEPRAAAHPFQGVVASLGVRRARSGTASARRSWAGTCST